jgi:serine/threonine protein phosphatase PrpC
MAHNGSSRRLTEEHRLDNEAEAARVREAGGLVVRNRPGGAARVVGTSTQTRYKGSMVTR